MNGEDDQLTIPEDSPLRAPAADLEPLPTDPNQPDFNPPPPDTSDYNTGLGSVFANHRDLFNYQVARLHGASEADALKVGDNGIGKWGDRTATYDTPMIALPPGTPGGGRNTLWEVIGPNGRTIARQADQMSANVKAKIDMNPATALKVGASNGLTPVRWRPFRQGSDSSLNIGSAGLPSLSSNEPKPEQLGPSFGTYQPSSRVPVGPSIGDQSQSDVDTFSQDATPQQQQAEPQTYYPPLHPSQLDPKGITRVSANADGSVNLSDGTTIYRNGDIVYKRGGDYIMQDIMGRTQKIGSTKSAEGTIQKDAEGRIFRIMPDGSSRDITPQGFATKPRTYRDANTGLLFDISDTNNPKPINLPGNPASIDTSKIKQGDWSSVPADIRDVAQNIAEYRYPKLSGFALRSPYFQQMFKVINAVDPSFDYKNYDARQRFLTDFSGSGKIGQNRISFNTALDHMNTALDSSEKLAQAYDADQISNKLELEGKSLAGNPALNNYRADAGTLINEYARAVSGAAPTDAERERWEQVLTGGHLTIPTGEQRKEAMQQMAHLLGSRLGEIAEQYKQTMGKKDLDISLLSPEAEKTLRRIGANDLIQKYGSSHGAYNDPNKDTHDTVPFPDQGETTANESIPIYDDGSGKFILSPNGKKIYLGQ